MNKEENNIFSELDTYHAVQWDEFVENYEGQVVKTKAVPTQPIAIRIPISTHRKAMRIVKKEGGNLSRLINKILTEFIEEYHEKEFKELEEAIRRAKAIKTEFENFPKDVQETILKREANEPAAFRFYGKAIEMYEKLEKQKQEQELEEEQEN